MIKTVDVSYGGENGFNQAIELSAETLGSVKLVQEKKLLQVRTFAVDAKVCVLREHVRRQALGYLPCMTSTLTLYSNTNIHTLQ